MDNIVEGYCFAELICYEAHASSNTDFSSPGFRLLGCMTLVEARGTGVPISPPLHQPLSHTTPPTEPAVLPATAAKGKGQTRSDISVIQPLGIQQFLQFVDLLSLRKYFCI